jgi:hypothetical protein
MIPFGLPKNDTSGFYRLNDDNTLLLQRSVDTLNLTTENHTEYQYPIDGWYWFDGEAEARSFFGLPEIKITANIPNVFVEIDPLILDPSLIPKYTQE